MLQDLLILEGQRTRALVSAQVVFAQDRCVECGICSYNCPSGIDVRRHVLQAISISDSRCLGCGECISRCPRGVLQFQRSAIFSPENGS